MSGPAPAQAAIPTGPAKFSPSTPSTPSANALDSAGGGTFSGDVRVRLQRLRSSVSLSGLALRWSGLRQSKDGSSLGPQAVRLSWRRMGSTTLWTLEDRDTGQVIASVRAEELEVEGFNLRLNLKPAPGRLRFVPTQVGSVDVIASLDLEEYVRGVLPSEMPATWPLETLKAQAIAARTYALFRKQIREREQGKYDVESTVMDQVFFAPDLNDESEARAQVDRALEETRGVVLLDHAARPFATYFHADCGGHTEEPSQVWGTSERLGTARDEGCPSSPLAHWSLKLSSQEIAERLQPRKGLALADIQIASRTPFGRVDSVKLRWNNGSSQILSSHLFRMAIGFDRLRSTRFTIVRESGREAGLEGLAGRLIFKGLGHGHGVGLCQWGARHLALKGKSYREILAHYYPRATLSDARSLAAQARP